MRSISKNLKLLGVFILLKFFYFLEFIDALFLWVFRVFVFSLILLFLGTNLVRKPEEFNSFLYNPLLTTIRPIKKNIPYKAKEVPFPEITAEAVLIRDFKKNKTLYQKDIDVRYPQASTTKLMTGLVALDLYNFSDYLEVPKVCADIEGSKLGFEEGERILVRDLFSTMLISSSNDAACTLAHAKLPEKEFVILMNAKAKEIGLENTSFSNPVGLDSYNGDHYSTAEDLYLLADYCLNKTHIASTISKTEYDLKSGIIPRKAYTTNLLLHVIPQSIGVKTGKTDMAKEVLIYGYSERQKNILIVVMQSEDRFLDVRHLLDWTLETYKWE